MHRWISGVCRVAFLHPDLGLGGAERLVVDAALALQERGYDVTVFTSHHEPDRCFQETCSGTLKVKTYGDWMPRHIAGRLHALFAYLRMIYLALVVTMTSSFDVIICDQVSACIPFIRLFSSARIIFYCHFPDLLLTKRQSTLKRLYRYPLDKLEEHTTGMADVVLVNSKFTAGVFRDTFTSLRHLQPGVLYPSLHTASFDKKVDDSQADRLVGTSSPHVFLSINRYERKKNLALALEAMLELKQLVTPAQWEACHLVMAGGYDPRLPENVEYFAELSAFANSRLPGKVTFLRSFSDEEKLILLRRCCALVYTPENEHFGICPVEAMYMSKPVVAVNSGGPMESVAAVPLEHAAELPGRSGFLCASDPKNLAQAMIRLVQEPNLSSDLGRNGKQRVAEKHKQARNRRAPLAPFLTASLHHLCSFDSQKYLDKLYAASNLQQLIAREDELDHEVKGLDSDMQTLVYENYNKFISATDTIRDMKNQVESMSDQMTRLSETMAKTQTLSTQIDDTLKPRRDRINKLAGGHLMLRRLQFLFELPARLRQCLEMDLLAQAVQYYAKARHVLERYKDMESFKAIHAECQEIVQAVTESLLKKLEDATLSRRDVGETMSLLVKLNPDNMGLADHLLDLARRQWEDDLQALREVYDNWQPAPADVLIVCIGHCTDVATSPVANSEALKSDEVATEEAVDAAAAANENVDVQADDPTNAQQETSEVIAEAEADAASLSDDFDINLDPQTTSAQPGSQNNGGTGDLPDDTSRSATPEEEAWDDHRQVEGHRLDIRMESEFATSTHTYASEPPLRTTRSAYAHRSHPCAAEATTLVQAHEEDAGEVPVLEQYRIKLVSFVQETIEDTLLVQIERICHDEIQNNSPTAAVVGFLGAISLDLSKTHRLVPAAKLDEICASMAIRVTKELSRHRAAALKRTIRIGVLRFAFQQLALLCGVAVNLAGNSDHAVRVSDEDTEQVLERLRQSLATPSRLALVNCTLAMATSVIEPAYAAASKAFPLPQGKHDSQSLDDLTVRDTKHSFEALAQEMLTTIAVEHANHLATPMPCFSNCFRKVGTQRDLDDWLTRPRHAHWMMFVGRTKDKLQSFARKIQVDVISSALKLFTDTIEVFVSFAPAYGPYARCLLLTALKGIGELIRDSVLTRGALHQLQVRVQLNLPGCSCSTLVTHVELEASHAFH
ncbi:uncharacterized protein MONBRDRAFT_37048 [Monosiga brevicollis MX1]|uniref:GDP-Man:Man(1)GlcNAc(2)-PP-Dol alpha-1,3-mannosyltransferase n=1 Tax=Monosiga brevicollis TaxID=81824 RepID=A9UZ94_MONBE|nr:uncharacterized protein MONBRDRAFT_37048 [Monosiga brevicollis MX1]EDQ89193.1 predicted protein [Monosiga brevicollis MX1]|eukprot:XP_001745769.1 hypothetical protein [Monosiga brevicollis MX1]